MLVLPDQKGLTYSGRIDFEDGQAPVFVYAGSYVSIRFTGSCIGVIISNQRSYGSNYVGYILDGVQGKFLLDKEEQEGDASSGQAGWRQGYCLGRDLAAGEHELLLFKRMDACHYFTFHGFELEDGSRVLPPAPLPTRRIEVFGDSVSCGEVSEAVEYVGKEDPEHDGEFSNSWYSYSWMTARRLNAELHITAQGGAALLDGTGWFCGPDFVGMESIYDRIQYNPQLGATKKWDFSRWIPHVVVLAIGQNDANPENYMAEDYGSEKAVNWRRRYRAFVEKLMELYPKAYFVLTTTILGHDAAWDRAIEEVCRELDSPKVQHFLYEKNGCGTPGHIRIPEAEKMAEELSAFIDSLGEHIWKV
ncbi:MAG: electron transporter RnfD [Firmicutes bacterium]|nr:electron transporter RnfD [Bacillota bacterium]